MFQRTMHVLLGTIFVVSFGIQSAWAVSFGKMDVASKMGEPFYAEVLLRLSDNESLKKTSVELGNAADYRILEVYRNPVLDSVRADIVDDERGARVALSSDAALDEAFFNIILKIRYGRSTHYKKLPVFLDVPSISSGPVVKSPQAKKVLASVDASNIDPTTSAAFATKMPVGAQSSAKEAFDEVDDTAGKAVDSFEPFDNWARTSKYGPMVYGDTITTVAQRLRLDDTFTNKQVMVALFEKNKGQFSKENINLIKAGSYLDVPTSQEVSKFSPKQANQILSEQTKAWKAMQKDSKYAALAEAQRTRYSSRVRIGQAASGTAKHPEVSGMLNAQKVMPLVSKQTKLSSSQASLSVKSLEKNLIEKDAAILALQQKATALEQKLKESKVASVTTPISKSATEAALDAQNKRLELVITRLKDQLEQAKGNISADSPSMGGWMMYALIALALIVLALLTAVLMLMRKDRVHPAEKDTVEDKLVDNQIADAGEEDLDATKQIDVNDLEMPIENTEQAEKSDPSKEMFSEEDLEEIPDLTDEETGEMEPFNAGDAPDPNVNYLEDADVYMRYGMEDEAEEQVRMALKLQADNPEAHAKMVQVQKAKGDDSAMQDAIATAKVTLTGSALLAFETLMSGEDSAFEPSTQEESNVEEGHEDGEDLDIEFTADSSNAEEVKDDFDFDFSDMVQENEEPDEKSKEEEPVSLISGELESVSPDGLEEDVEEFESPLDDELSDLDSVDFGDLDFGETGEVDLGMGTEVVSSDESSQEHDSDLNDYEIDKAKSEAEAEKNATSVELDMDSDDPFAAANEALNKEDKNQAIEDWDLSAFDTVSGEESDPLSLIESEEDSEDASAGIELQELDLSSDLEELGSELEEQSNEVVIDNEEDEVSLDNLNINLDSSELPDDEVADDDINILDAGFDDLDISTTAVDPAEFDLNTDENGLESDSETSAGDLDMDFDLPDLDAEDTALAPEKGDSPLVMNSDSLSEEEINEVDLDSDEEEISLDDLDMDFDLPDLDAEDAALESEKDDSTLVMDSDSLSEDEINEVDLDSDEEEISLDDLDMDFDLPDLDAEDTALAPEKGDSPLVMNSDSLSEEEINEVDLDSDEEEISLDDLDMDFDLPDLDAEDTALESEEDESTFVMDTTSASEDDDDLDIDLTELKIDEVEDNPADFEQSEEDENIDELDLGMDDLDISTTAVDPAEYDFNIESNDSDSNENTDDIFADLDSDMADLEMLKDNNKSKKYILEDDLDKTFILNDVAKNKALLEDSASKKSNHFANIDDALEGASSVSNDPMVDAFSTTEELDGVHKPQDTLSTLGASAELDELMKDLDGLLDEDNNKK